MATIDSPSAMITISEKRSAKCPGETRKPRTPNTNGPEKSIASARIHSAAWSVPSVSPAAMSSAGAGKCRAGQAHDRLSGVHVVVGLGEDEDVQPADGGIGEPEEQRVVPEGMRRGEGRYQEGAHHGEDEQPLLALVGGDVVGEPGVGAPRPPERGEHQHALPQALPGRVLSHQRRDLGQREHEDQVEEQLERGHALLGHLLPGRAHRRTVPATAHARAVSSNGPSPTPRRRR